jgi:hypothetical protein
MNLRRTNDNLREFPRRLSKIEARVNSLECSGMNFIPSSEPDQNGQDRQQQKCRDRIGSCLYKTYGHSGQSTRISILEQ